MNSLRILDKRAAYFAAAIAMVAAVIVPVLVSAAQLTERSIALSSSSKSATGVTYTVNFTVDNDAGAFVVDFCSDSPVVGQDCDTPAGFVASTATSATSGFTDVSALDANTIVVTGAIDASADDEISVALANITNPSAAGSLYARIVTYGTDTEADKYLSNDINGTLNDATPIDQGSVAVAITDSVGVSGAVLESMLFCVSGEAIVEPDCDTTGNDAPTIRLGETVGDTLALIPTEVSEGSIFTQISTNASSGAVISLKSNATGCGGLIRSGAPSECDILPAIADGIDEGEAKFGVKTATATNTATANATGTLQPVTGSGYANSVFFLGYEAGDTSGITSTYGDPFLDTNNAPANNKNMQLTFGASVSNDTPAGLYSTDLRLIATGKF